MPWAGNSFQGDTARQGWLEAVGARVAIGHPHESGRSPNMSCPGGAGWLEAFTRESQLVPRGTLHDRRDEVDPRSAAPAVPTGADVQGPHSDGLSHYGAVLTDSYLDRILYRSIGAHKNGEIYER